MTILDEVAEEHEQRVQNDPEYSQKIQRYYFQWWSSEWYNYTY